MTTGIADEITAELLGDVALALRAILVNDHGVRASSVEASVNARPPRLAIWIKRAGAVANLEAEVGKMLQALRATILESLPSLAEGLTIRAAMRETIEIVIEAPAPHPIYPHIITAHVRELRATEAGKLAIARGELKL